MAPVPSSMRNNNHQYGSINVRDDDEATEETSAVLTTHSDSKRKLSSSPLVVASLAFLFVSALAMTRHSGQQQPPSQQAAASPVDDLPVLGKVHRSIADTPHAFSQRVDHLDESNQDTWQQRYYKKSEFFRGPGSPIFLVVGGEGALDTGMFYPFVDTFLAEQLGAFVLHVEHRFYGESQPIDPLLLKNTDLHRYHTARQSMLDHIAVVQSYQDRLGCSRDQHSKDYCPVISVGGSYPGFLSAIMRLHYPHVIDIGYASSAPLLLYAMQADNFGYMDHVTEVTDKASKGCADAVRKTLHDVDTAIREKTSDDKYSDNYFKDFAYDHLNLCFGTIPSYIVNKDLLSKEAMMIVEYTFADWNMFFYPPDDDSDLSNICRVVFQNDELSSLEKMVAFWRHVEVNTEPDMPCFDMSSQLPDGRHATISGSDWSGVGTGYDGFMFDYHCCSTLTPAISFSHESMFPYREWTLEWLTEHCLDRFDVVPDPALLLDEFKFDDLVGQGATRILFTNGMNDLWSKGSYLESLSDSILAINMPNGAHHSELGHYGDGVTDDVKEAQKDIHKVLDGWLDEINEKMTE